MIIPVIMAGGSGTRLWPLSRGKAPKQFWPLMGDDTLLQATLKRFGDHARFAAPLILTHDDYRFLVAEQCRSIGVEPAAICLETARRNTAVVGAIAALQAQRMAADATIFLCPADHVIKDKTAFLSAVAEAEQAAQKGFIVTFGIRPTHAETGYGYIELGASLSASVHAVQRFVEKPDCTTAQTYVSAGTFVWNSGMFMARADTIIAEYQRHAPDVLAAATRILDSAERDLHFIRFAPAAMQGAPSISIDYAVMEKTDRAAVIPVDFGWSDIGSWQSLWQESTKDANGNVLKGSVVAQNCQNILCETSAQTVAALGLHDIAIINTEDALLVMDMKQGQSLKGVIDGIAINQPHLADIHPVELRIWGELRTITHASNHRIRRVTIKPHGAIAYQKHQHRTEHWYIISGTAEAIINGQTSTLSAGQSQTVPQGIAHGITNPSGTPLVFIEVQTGDFTDESDVERLNKTVAA